MRRLLKAEVGYNWIHLVVIFFVPLIFVYQMAASSENLNFLYVLFAFITINNMNTFRIKEKRDRFHVLLPLSGYKIALARIGSIVIMPCFVIYVVYIFLHLLYGEARTIIDLSMLVGFGILNCFFSAFFVLYDLFSDFLRKYSSRILLGLVLLGGVINLLGVFVFIRTKNAGGIPSALADIIEFVISNNPFAGEYGVEKFLVLSILLSLLSVTTFGRRRSYVEV